MLDDLTSALDSEIRKEGFRRKGRTWSRHIDRFRDVVEVQETRWSESDATRVTLNLGILEPLIYEICWGKNAPPFPQETDCTVRRRIGELTEERKDIWWEVREHDLTGHRQIISTLLRSGLPFFEENHSLDRLIRCLRSDVEHNGPPVTHLYLGIALSLSGDRESGVETVRTAGNKFPAWHERSEEVLERISSSAGPE